MEIQFLVDMLDLYLISLISLVLGAVGVVLCWRFPCALRQVVRVMSFEDSPIAAGSWLESGVLVHSLLSWCHANRPPPGVVPVVCSMPVNASCKRSVNPEQIWARFPKGFNLE